MPYTDPLEWSVDDEQPARRCSDGMCGADDCARCNPVTARFANEEE
jgi:hypothetical protein